VIIHTCACGRPCRGRAGWATHARACAVERARSSAVVAAMEAGRHATAMAEGDQAALAVLAAR
jgi:hypothetical protein